MKVIKNMNPYSQKSLEKVYLANSYESVYKEEKYMYIWHNITKTKTKPDIISCISSPMCSKQVSNVNNTQLVNEQFKCKFHLRLRTIFIDTDFSKC